MNKSATAGRANSISCNGSARSKILEAGSLKKVDRHGRTATQQQEEVSKAARAAWDSLRNKPSR